MIARDLLSKGADINAVCQHPDIGKAFWVAAVFEEFIGEESVRAEVCLFFLGSRFRSDNRKGAKWDSCLNVSN